MKTYTDFLAERANSPQGALRKQKQQAQNTNNAREKAAALGSAIVRTRRGGTDKEAVGAPRNSGPGVRQPEPGLVRIRHPRAPDEKQAGQQPGTTRGTTVPSTTPKKPNYAQRVASSAIDQAGKNLKGTKDKFSAQNVGKNIANTVHNAPKNIGKGILRSAKRSLRNKSPQDSPTGSVEKVQNNNAIG